MLVGQCHKPPYIWWFIPPRKIEILGMVSLWLWVTTLVAKSMGKSWWIGEWISLKHVIPLLKIRLTAKAATVGFRIRTMVLHPWGGPCTLQWRLRQLEILKGSRGKRNPWNQSAQTYKPISSKNSAGILCLIRCMSLAAKKLACLEVAQLFERSPHNFRKYLDRA